MIVLGSQKLADLNRLVQQLNAIKLVNCFCIKFLATEAWFYLHGMRKFTIAIQRRTRKIQLLLCHPASLLQRHQQLQQAENRRALIRTRKFKESHILIIRYETNYFIFGSFCLIFETCR